ncbi:MAG: AMP-binding enzyme [Bilophila wadsworthia]
MPVPGTLARIVDTEDGERVLAHNEIGELVIKGPQVMKGYWNRPEETARTIRDGWLYTGDIAYMDEEGYFYIVDRKKDLIIVGGYNVYPREIDEVLHTHPKIREAVTVGVNHRSRGETVKAYIVPEEGATDRTGSRGLLSPETGFLQGACLIEFREELPKTMVGSVVAHPAEEELHKTTRNRIKNSLSRRASQGRGFRSELESEKRKQKRRANPRRRTETHETASSTGP